MIAGSYPRFEWRPNPDGSVRTIAEACEIARKWGVRIPEDIAFFLDEDDELGPEITAKTTEFREFEGTIIPWSWFYNRLTGKIPFLIRRDIMESDEAIVAVIGHEVFETERLKEIFADGAPVEAWEAETSPNNPGNAHWLAWDYADSLVARMRREQP